MLEFDKVIKVIKEYKKKSSIYLETAYSLDFNCKNGFFPCEVYNLDRSIALEILPRLLYFRDKTTTYPGGFDSLEEWRQELDNMCNEFYNYIFDEDFYSGSVINPYIKLAEYANVLWN